MDLFIYMPFYLYFADNGEDMYSYSSPGRVQTDSSENISDLLLEWNESIFAWLQVSTMQKIRYWEIHFEIRLIGIFFMSRYIAQTKKYIFVP